MDTTDKIDITGVDLINFVQQVYALSEPVGMGFLHFVEGPLSEEDAKNIVGNGNDFTAITMDYVRGRACKMVVWRDNNKLWIRDRWFDHSTEDLINLLKNCGLEDKSNEVKAGFYRREEA